MASPAVAGPLTSQLLALVKATAVVNGPLLLRTLLAMQVSSVSPVDGVIVTRMRVAASAVSSKMWIDLMGPLTIGVGQMVATLGACLLLLLWVKVLDV